LDKKISQHDHEGYMRSFNFSGAKTCHSYYC